MLIIRNIVRSRCGLHFINTKFQKCFCPMIGQSKHPTIQQIISLEYYVHGLRRQQNSTKESKFQGASHMTPRNDCFKNSRKTKSTDLFSRLHGSSNACMPDIVHDFQRRSKLHSQSSGQYPVRNNGTNYRHTILPSVHATYVQLRITLSTTLSD